MDIKEFHPFIKCRHPTKVRLNGIDMVLPCGRCDMCKDSKAQKYISQIAREESTSKFQLFLTLTYSPEWLPLYEIVDNQDEHIIYDKLHRPHSQKWNWDKELTRYNNPLVDVSLVPAFARLYPKRGTSDYEVLDAQDDYETLHIKDIYFQQNLSSYYKHLATYKNEFCQTNFDFYKGFIALAPKRDLETFLLRLKNFAVRKCKGATFRYFAVSDYGTNGCLPHWHIILFTDSADLVRGLQPTINQGTQKRPSYTSPNLCKMWKYGITNISRVEKSCAHYVGGYVNAPSNFPRIFKGILRPRAFHSVKLGTLCQEEVVAEHLRNFDFEFFQHLQYSDYQGLSHSYEWSQKDYSAFLSILPYTSRANFCNYEDLICEVLRFINKCISQYDNLTYKDISLALYDYACTPAASVSLRDYYRLQNYFGNHYSSDINLFYNLVLSVVRIKRNMTLFCVDFSQYCRILTAFDKWYYIRQLKGLYSPLSLYPSLAIEYYHNLDNDFSSQSNGSYFRSYTDRFATRLARSFKHRDVAERYRFN